MTKDVNWELARKQKTLTDRAAIIRAIRAFFIAREFLEVETPHRIKANAPELHIDAVASDGMWLQTSPELAMKRLLAAGYGDLFQICRVWRDHEKGSRHLPEFTMLEWYRPGADYHRLMEDCEELLTGLVPAGRLAWQGKAIDLARPWRRLTVAEAFRRYAGCDVDEALRQERFEETLTTMVEPGLGPDPVFLVEYPSSLAALARKKPGHPAVAERCELYIGGLELANGFSELADPAEQRVRFAAEEEQRRLAGKAPYPMPETFLTELANMPESAGIALGIDRLVMLLTGAATINEVVAFGAGDL